MHFVACFLVIFALSADVVMSQSIPADIIDCGFPGISYQACVNKGCLWNTNARYWCYRQALNVPNAPDGPDGEHSVGDAERLPNNLPRRPQVPYQPTDANIQYSGPCLFHCTAIPQGRRVSCSNGYADEFSCLAVGCCYDRNDLVAQRKCYYPAPDEHPCPREECMAGSGTLRQCGPDNMLPSACEGLGCCSRQVGPARLCYHTEDPSSARDTPTLNTPRPFFGNSNNQPSVQPNPVTFTNPTTTATTTTTTPATTTTKKPSFIEMLRRNNGGNLEGYSLHDILTKSLDQLMRRNTDESHNGNVPTTRGTTTTATTRTTTTIATTTRTTTPTTQPPPPVTTVVCSWGRCRSVDVPTQPPPNCYPRECGQPRFFPGSTLPPTAASPKKIVGGTRAHPFSHPWTAMILKKEGIRTFLCGAAIICDKWLVTAAHCLNRQTEKTSTPDLDAIFYKIYAGRYVGWKEKYGKQVQVFNGREDIDYMFQHESFTPGINRGVITFDIALIKLRKRIVFDQYIQPVCLPTERAAVNKVFWATGWGITKNRGPNDSRMKQLGIRVVNESVCDEKVPNFAEARPAGVLCGGDEKSQDTCTGDSGGPVVGPKVVGVGRDRRRVQRWMLYGLTSIGSPSCNTLLFDRQPAIYTDVHHYLSWIMSRTNNCCE